MFKRNVRIQFVDTDASTRIHYSKIFRFFEYMDHEFFRHIGYPYKKLFEMGYEMPRVHVQCDFAGMVEYDDELEAEASIARIGNSSFAYHFRFYKGGQLVIKGGLTIVFIDRTTGKSVPIPDFVRTEMEKHLEESIG